MENLEVLSITQMAEFLESTLSSYMVAPTLPASVVSLNPVDHLVFS